MKLLGRYTKQLENRLDHPARYKMQFAHKDVPGREGGELAEEVDAPEAVRVRGCGCRELVQVRAHEAEGWGGRENHVTYKVYITK